jgi:hypothetical protein
MSMAGRPASQKAPWEYNRQAVELEIELVQGDCPDATFWRQHVLAAGREVETNWEEPSLNVRALGICTVSISSFFCSLT